MPNAKRKIPRSNEASVTHGAPSSKCDAQASNDAQASQMMQKTFETMRKASSVMKKHPYDAQSITCDAQASTRCHKHQVISLNSMTDVNHSQWKVNRHKTELERNLAPAKETETYKKTEHKFPKRTVSSNRAQALKISITGPKSYRTANNALMH